ncbi:hypothetical protein BJY01DRAFT_201590 [Aspergillus pseudoustus]|uniref:Uncharacterized protein n=1 Tax=Aspergillus pseudoustus TaxID=1810923 RepID=A0ABR4L078_9EURO
MMKRRSTSIYYFGLISFPTFPHVTYLVAIKIAFLSLLLVYDGMIDMFSQPAQVLWIV